MKRRRRFSPASTTSATPSPAAAPTTQPSFRYTTYTHYTTASSSRLHCGHDERCLLASRVNCGRQGPWTRARLTKYLTTILFLTVFKHQRQRAHATRMPVKSSTMNIYMLDNETRWDDREIKWQLHNENRECKITNSTHCDT